MNQPFRRWTLSSGLMERRTCLRKAGHPPPRHHAHLGGLIRLEVNAYPSKALMGPMNGVSDPMELVRTATSSMLRPQSY